MLTMSDVLLLLLLLLLLCRRPERTEGEELHLKGRSDIQTKDRLQGKMDGCSHRGILRMERFIVAYVTTRMEGTNR